ncbi:hypothetical protein GCM10010912_00020 [Paenibacillus albidus]|uniref:DUF218 domain-containing protein n=1 Tax=Paenibacillus albidus TaxID=2041023 RepID=A0A917F9Q3_9BACL|nr:YdcF family protein [Paenibacillus albidus]GGF58821.1 hypothetical protein GCM10010912_00020 [Paenibacillus albidus]
MKDRQIRKKKPRKGAKKRLVFYLCVLLLLTVFLTAGSFLSLNESPQQADVIIVLSGGPGRMEAAAKLYEAGYAPYLLLSNGEEAISRSGDMRETALALGIPEKAIVTENEALSTYQNAELTLPIMQEHKFTSAIVVSSDFHMRRVKFNFERVYKKSGIELTYVGSPSGYNAKRWWSGSYSRETTFNEYVKMIGNAFGYNGPEAKGVLNEIKAWFR